MLHRALLGSLERFFGVLIEHYAGAFPVWLSPHQVQVVPVGEDFFKEAKQFSDELAQAGIRVWFDDFNEIVMSKSDYNDRKCWVEKPPSVYLNKNNQNGFFRNQKFFYSVTIPQRKNNEKHYSNRRLFAECYRMYTEDQNNYYKIAQLLGKKQKSRDEKIKWRDIFDEKFVINREKLNTQTFFEIDKQHYGR